MDERQQSEFNDAIGYLNRLNSLFYLCDNSSIELDAFSWFHSLMALERELSTEMEEKELSAFETLRAFPAGLIVCLSICLCVPHSRFFP